MMGGIGSGNRKRLDLLYRKPGVGPWRRDLLEISTVESRLRREGRKVEADAIRRHINKLLAVRPRVVIGLDERGYPKVRSATYEVRVYTERRT